MSVFVCLQYWQRRALAVSDGLDPRRSVFGRAVSFTVSIRDPSLSSRGVIHNVDLGSGFVAGCHSLCQSDERSGGPSGLYGCISGRCFDFAIAW